MSSYLINKNICFYYLMRKVVGKSFALRVARVTEWLIIIILGRDKLA